MTSPQHHGSTTAAPRHKAFPLGFVTTGKRLLLIGGCGDHLCRIKHAVRFDWAVIHVVFPPNNRAPLCEACQQDERVILDTRDFDEKDVKAADLIIAELYDEEKIPRLADWAKQHGVLLNIMDIMDYCDIHYTSFTERGPLLLSVLSGGAAPALTARLRRKLEAEVGDGWGLAAHMLAEVRSQLPRGKKRMELLKNLARSQDMQRMIAACDEQGMKRYIDDEIKRLDITD